MQLEGAWYDFGHTFGAWASFWCSSNSLIDIFRQYNWAGHIHVICNMFLWWLIQRKVCKLVSFLYLYSRQSASGSMTFKFQYCLFFVITSTLTKLCWNRKGCKCVHLLKTAGENLERWVPNIDFSMDLWKYLNFSVTHLSSFKIRCFPVGDISNSQLTHI